MRLTKLEAARRQLKTAVELYFAQKDEVSTHILATAAYAIVRDINEHRGGEPMLKDLHVLLDPDDAREFKKYVNRPENFLKHADKDPDDIGQLDPRWTEVLLWEASRKYCEMTGTPNKILLTYILRFVSHHPEAKEEYAIRHTLYRRKGRLRVWGVKLGPVNLIPGCSMSRTFIQGRSDSSNCFCMVCHWAPSR
jgi:hypothetical protein